jgi:FKBP-type peptidyl-prolyl cis-trans isomerase FkpA
MQRTGSIILIATAMVVALAGCQQKPAETKAPELTEDQKAIYAFGLAVGRQISGQTKQLRLTPEEVGVFKNGFADALADKAKDFDVDAYGEKFRTLAEARIAEGAAALKKEGDDFLAKAAAEAGAVKTESGIIIRTLTAGKGDKPKASDTVKVNYEGKLTNGEVFDSSIKRGEPAEFALDRVIPCWTEGVQRMQVGEKARLVCPATLAYGDRATGNIPANSTLVFEVELLEIKAPK